jgi:hypothetical protein
MKEKSQGKKGRKPKGGSDSQAKHTGAAANVGPGRKRYGRTRGRSSRPKGSAMCKADRELTQQIQLSTKRARKLNYQHGLEVEARIALAQEEKKRKGQQQPKAVSVMELLDAIIDPFGMGIGL